MRNFKTLEVWQLGMELTKSVYLQTAKLPQKEQFNLISQLNRAAVSIPSNIAEGCSRSSDRDFKRFLEIAMGSSFELETQLILCKSLGYFQEKESLISFENLDRLQRKLNAFIQKIK